MTMPLAKGALFARDYRLERPLAEGGMGAVYVATQLSTGRKRALKLMQPELAQDEELRKRFLLEARVGARIPSEHVVEVLAAGVDEETRAPFLVMELLEGEDLATRLERQGGLGKDEVRELFRQMCHALGAAHKLGIVHRDLKPANVFLAKPAVAGATGFQVKILDFGIAKLTAQSATVKPATVPGSMMGTPLWMAPEQTDGSEVTPAADVWALGLILYNAVSGRGFWRTSNSATASFAEIFREVLVDPIPPASERARSQGVASSVPIGLDAVFASSITRDPRARYADAEAFWRALDGALDGAAFVPGPTGGAAALSATEYSDPKLELAVEPSSSRVQKGPAPDAATAPGLAAPRIERPPPVAATLPSRPLLADPERVSIPWLPIVVGLFVLAALGGGLIAWIGRGGGHVAVCRLCTLEGGTYANGPMELREVRHAVEEHFGDIDSRCIMKAERAGKVTLSFTLKNGVPTGRPGFSPVNDTNLCIADALRSLHVGPAGERIVQGGYAFRSEGPTHVQYILDYDPKQSRQ